MDPDELPEDINLLFEGIDGAEAESFILSVQRTARKEGKSRDNEWIIDLVSSSLTGDALRWYVELDEDTQNDWKLLRKAILQQYPKHSKPSTASLQPTIPTPAAAANPPNTISLIQPIQASNSTYRIRVYFDITPSDYYLSTNDDKHVCLTKNVERALSVCWTPETELQLIENGVKTQRMIGLIWTVAIEDRHNPSSTTDVALFFLSDPLGNVPSITSHSGRVQMTRWSVDKDGWLQSYSDLEPAPIQNQFYTKAGGAEGSFTRVCLIPGIARWGLQIFQFFTMKLESI
ncbi:hypothetical protein M407DRAFT_17329 [Tulasnella calospora MUT 4182]|uniref:Uncharacterized protein n=1 Tax=Tulasnella calospora MUT 4182 TaxID=1051891 RepID=A0A0C3MJ65_9AGAM|nr:hypothetical protein M407DRAFT_17329 [Tulasnella calospora MUT 4182]